MKKVLITLFIASFSMTTVFADIDCPADSSYHIDTRTMLPDGSPNPTWNQEISTGLCGCIAFTEGTSISGNLVTFTIRIVDNEPIRGLEFDVYHDSDVLIYGENGSIAKGDKLNNVTDPDGNPRTMTLLANEIDDYLKIMAYSTSQARTAGDSLEGDLMSITYELIDGATLPENVTFHFGLCNLPGTSADPELLNVVCAYPSLENPQVVTTGALGVGDELIPNQFALHQNYPNPFNPVTQIKFDVPENSGILSLSIYNVLGQKVSTLMSGHLNAGQYSFEWNATDMSGQSVASGIYFYELKSPNFTARKKMLLLC